MDYLPTVVEVQAAARASVAGPGPQENVPWTDPLTALLPDLTVHHFGGTAPAELREIAGIAMGHPIPRINPGTGYPVNMPYLRAQLRRWATRQEV